MEAWDRGLRWRENLTAGRKRLAAEETELLRSAVKEACRLEDRALRAYGFDEELSLAAGVPADRGVGD
jgi:hypothetical protein